MTPAVVPLPVLEMKNISMQFDGIYALNDVSLTIGPGEIHGLLGQNGSGKSTLVKVLSGYHTPEPGGRILVNGSLMPMPLTAQRLGRQGIAFVHQNLGLIPELSIAENFVLSELSTEMRLRISWSRVHELATAAIARFGVSIDSRQRVSELAPIDLAIVAIVRALEKLRLLEGPESSAGNTSDAPSSGLLVLDEPTAFLEKSSVQRLGAFLRTLASAEHSILLVSHNLEEVQAFTDRITVLRDGARVAGDATSNVSTEQMIRLIVGEDSPEAALTTTTDNRLQNVADEVDAETDVLSIDLRNGGRIRNLRVNLQPGNVIGITGLRGSGWEDVPDSLFGLLPADGSIESRSGRLSLTNLTPRRAINWGVGLVPADRATQGGMGELSISENLMMLRLDQYSRRGILQTRRLLRDAEGLVKRFRVRPPSVDLTFSQLSGGNQQKVVLAKWINYGPRLLLLNEPTQGVDVGARQQIYGLLHRLADSGCRILLASSDYDELAIMCSRVFIVADGCIVVDLAGAGVTESAIAEACLSANAHERGLA